MSQFAGKTAVISGGAEGIGLSIAQALGDQKMNIVIADIDKANLQKARSKLEDAGISVLTVVLDVAQEDQWQEVANQAIARFEKIHMVVNNAGVNRSQQGYASLVNPSILQNSIRNIKPVQRTGGKNHKKTVKHKRTKGK